MSSKRYVCPELPNRALCGNRVFDGNGREQGSPWIRAGLKSSDECPQRHTQTHTECGDRGGLAVTRPQAEECQGFPPSPPELGGLEQLLPQTLLQGPLLVWNFRPHDGRECTSSPTQGPLLQPCGGGTQRGAPSATSHPSRGLPRAKLPQLSQHWAQNLFSINCFEPNFIFLTQEESGRERPDSQGGGCWGRRDVCGLLTVVSFLSFFFPGIICPSWFSSKKLRPMDSVSGALPRGGC